MSDGRLARPLRFLVTGAAGFIGFHLCRRLLADGHLVEGLDAMTPYYDVTLKRARLGALSGTNRFVVHEAALEDAVALARVFERGRFDVVVHLAAQAGVRYSLDHPQSYVSSNLVGTANLLESLRRHPPDHLLFASTSSVYGNDTETPFRETRGADHPLTLYAATKLAGEAMTHAYAHLFSIPTTAFRFFTVYGEWGRPDMALFKFVSAILEDRPIEIYGEGRMRRDFTYVGDLVEAIVRLVAVVPGTVPACPDDSLSPVAPHRIVNIGGGNPVDLLDFVALVERATGRKAVRVMKPMQPGDVDVTYAAPDLLAALTGYVPQTPLEIGVGRFVAWYRDWALRGD